MVLSASKAPNWGKKRWNNYAKAVNKKRDIKGPRPQCERHVMRQLIMRLASRKTITLVLNYFCLIWPFVPPWPSSPALCAYADAPRPSAVAPQWWPSALRPVEEDRYILVPIIIKFPWSMSYQFSLRLFDFAIIFGQNFFELFAFLLFFLL